MVGRHLFVSIDDVACLLDEPIDNFGAFAIHEFTRERETGQSDAVVEHLLHLISQDLSEGSPTGYTFIEHIVGALVAHVRGPRPTIYGSSSRRGSSGQVLAHRAASLIASKLETKLLLGDIAKELGVSVPYLCRTFKQSEGCSLHHYIVRQRIERAKWLLRHSRRPLSEVGYASGFSDQSQFSKTFLKIAGTTPSKFRDG
ncbi:helix-turn-helix transcriptional regulator [Rubellimicrobium arenae]|uniref:helix-turn-helix transcriptional regulator n=1 Tax=Rubellimicrobium arenae TaxID=2817372 RepID=UPI001B30DEEF|nr:helix-turn-helix transcriptional regulator [Rubellimicrobium arenae]